ncbi:NupC/NupG family nucleoside CNT transporter, partial [Singulisphaera rosea]
MTHSLSSTTLSTLVCVLVFGCGLSARAQAPTEKAVGVKRASEEKTASTEVPSKPGNRDPRLAAPPRIQAKDTAATPARAEPKATTKAEASPKDEEHEGNTDSAEATSKDGVVEEWFQVNVGPWNIAIRMPKDPQSQLTFDRVRGFVGILCVLGLAYALSEDRRAVSWRILFWGLFLQWAFALIVLKVPAGEEVLAKAGDVVKEVLACGLKGSEFVFGPKLVDAGGPAGFVFAFRVLPIVIFVSALFAVLYHLRVMQIVVRMFGWVMVHTMGTSGAESLNVAASLFLGQTEAPLTIRPYLPKLTRSELLTVMTSGMAHVSGGTMAAYFASGIEARHVLTAVIMTAPGTILLSKILIPEKETPETVGTIQTSGDWNDANVLDAASRGTREGLQLALNIAAMLIAFLGLIALVNLILGIFGESLESLLGFVLAPVAYMLGVPWTDSRTIGSLLGTRTVLNELIAFGQLGTLKPTLNPRSFTIATFALCGFANLSSIGIQLGGIGALAPERRADLARLGFRALL